MPRAVSDQNGHYQSSFLHCATIMNTKGVSLIPEPIVLAVAGRCLQSSTSHGLIIAYTFLMSKLVVYAEAADSSFYAAQSTYLTALALV